MPSPQKILVVLVAVIIGVALLPSLVGSIDQSTGQQDIVNETATAPAPGDVVDLDGYAIDDGSETVYWLNDSTDDYETVAAGTDYELDNGPGELEILENGKIEEGDSLKASYTYQATDSTTAAVAGIITILFILLMLAMMARELMGYM